MSRSEGPTRSARSRPRGSLRCPCAIVASTTGRFATGLNQKDSAERLGLKVQQVQKYEATDYTSASLERVRAVVRVLGVRVREEVSLAGK